jgi:hypothetical protein
VKAGPNARRAIRSNSRVNGSKEVVRYILLPLLEGLFLEA